MFKPMLAYTIKDTASLEYPVAVTPKLDGIRAIVRDGVVYSRSMKPIRSKAVQRIYGKPEFNNFDGELIYGNPTDPDVFNKTTSFCMSTEIPEGMDDEHISYHVFDYTDGDEWDSRAVLVAIQASTRLSRLSNIKCVPCWIAEDEKALLELETEILNDGYEGAMVSSLTGLYKQGRSTAKEGYLGKLKRFSDSEAIIVGFEEQMHNTNEQEISETGYAKRSSAKAGLVGTGYLGSLVVKDIKTGVEFNIGSGFDLDIRKKIWDNQRDYIGKLVKYKHFDIQSGYDKPRFPIFIGFRDEDDM